MGFSERLNQLIHSRHKDVKSFINDFNNKHIDGVKLAPATVSNILNKGAECRYPLVVALSKYFHVSTDYLLGLSDVQTSDIDIKAAADMLGLHPDTALMLHAFKECYSNSQFYLNALNYLINEMCEPSFDEYRQHSNDPISSKDERLCEYYADYSTIGKIAHVLSILRAIDPYGLPSYFLTDSGQIKKKEDLSYSDNAICSISVFDVVSRIFDTIKSNYYSYDSDDDMYKASIDYFESGSQLDESYYDHYSRPLKKRPNHEAFYKSTSRKK